MAKRKKEGQPQQISVSDLKTHLLEVMRKVAAGTSYQVTKSNKPIAFITPLSSAEMPISGFAKIKINSASRMPTTGDWTFDAHNVK